jgi:hypothetical protein
MTPVLSPSDPAIHLGVTRILTSLEDHASQPQSILLPSPNFDNLLTPHRLTVVVCGQVNITTIGQVCLSW